MIWPEVNKIKVALKGEENIKAFFSPPTQTLIRIVFWKMWGIGSLFPNITIEKNVVKRKKCLKHQILAVNESLRQVVDDKRTNFQIGIHSNKSIISGNTFHYFKAFVWRALRMNFENTFNKLLEQKFLIFQYRVSNNWRPNAYDST